MSFRSENHLLCLADGLVDVVQTPILKFQEVVTLVRTYNTLFIIKYLRNLFSFSNNSILP